MFCAEAESNATAPSTSRTVLSVLDTESEFDFEAEVTREAVVLVLDSDDLLESLLNELVFEASREAVVA